MFHKITKHNSGYIDTAMILAAGFGTRMGELTRNLPKPLLSLGKYTLLDILLNQLKSAGITRVIINLHYLGKQIRRHIGQHGTDGLEIIFSEEPRILGTGGGIARAEQFFPPRDVLVINSDILCDISLDSFIEFHRNRKSLATMAVWPSRDFQNYSLVKYSADKKLRGFTHKGIPEDYPGPMGIYMGFQVLSFDARRYLKEEFSSVIETFYRNAVAANKAVSVFEHPGYYTDFGTKSQYMQTLEELKEGRLDIETL